jgi:hypothetical protein
MNWWRGESSLKAPATPRTNAQWEIEGPRVSPGPEEVRLAGLGRLRWRTERPRRTRIRRARRTSVLGHPVGGLPGPRSGRGLPNGTFSDGPADNREVVGSNPTGPIPRQRLAPFSKHGLPMGVRKRGLTRVIKQLGPESPLNPERYDLLAIGRAKVRSKTSGTTDEAKNRGPLELEAL